MSNYTVNAGFPAGNACTGSTVAKGDVKLPYLKAIPALRSKKETPLSRDGSRGGYCFILLIKIRFKLRVQISRLQVQALRQTRQVHLRLFAVEMVIAEIKEIN